MGRAAGRVYAATAISPFDALLGTRRGVAVGDIMARSPGPGDRAEYERMAGEINRSNTNPALTLFLEHHAKIERLPLLKELHERYSEHLVEVGKRHHLPDASKTLLDFGFVVEDDRGRLFESDKLQRLFNDELVSQARTRSLALFKTGQRTQDSATDVFYIKEFQKVAGAQCFAARERICKEFLDSEVPIHLRDVTAWRAAILAVLEEPERYSSSEEMAKLLRRVRPTAKVVKPVPRRRQRYLR